MKKTLILALVIIATLVICFIEIRTEFKDEFGPKISQSSEYSGVFV